MTWAVHGGWLSQVENWVVIRSKLRKALIEELHRDHLGMVRMKVAISHSYLWWLGLDKDMEGQVKNCESCQAVRKNPAPSPLHPWLWPAKPLMPTLRLCRAFSRKNVLHCPRCTLKMAWSNWDAVHSSPMNNCGSLSTIFYYWPSRASCDRQWSHIGYRRLLNFSEKNDVKHIRVLQYCSPSNGAVECFIQMFKSAMTVSVTSELSFQHWLPNFLMTYMYCTTPHATTSKTPSELFIGRKMCTRFDLLRPDTSSIVLERKSQQNTNHDRRSCLHEFQPGQEVMVRNYCGGPVWVLGVVLELYGPLTYSIQLNSHVVWKCQTDQLRSFFTSIGSSEQEASSEEQFIPPTTSTTDWTEPPSSQSCSSDIARKSFQECPARDGGPSYPFSDQRPPLKYQVHSSKWQWNV